MHTSKGIPQITLKRQQRRVTSVNTPYFARGLHSWDSRCVSTVIVTSINTETSILLYQTRSRRPFLIAISIVSPHLAQLQSSVSPSLISPLWRGRREWRRGADRETVIGRVLEKKRSGRNSSGCAYERECSRIGHTWQSGVKRSLVWKKKEKKRVLVWIFGLFYCFPYILYKERHGKGWFFFYIFLIF